MSFQNKYIIFPRLVWSIIYQFLNYNERCHLRATCRYLSRFANNEPLKYWLLRNDPVCLNLIGNALLMAKLKYGIYVDLRNIFISDIEAEIMNKLLYIGGNIESYKNRGILRNHQYPDLYVAFINGHFELAELIKKNIDIIRCPTPGYAKYNLANENFENMTEYIYTFNGDYMYYLMLRYKVPDQYYKIVPATHYAKFKFAVKTCNFNAVKFLIKSNCDYLNLHLFLKMACKKNCIKIVKLLFTELSKYVCFTHGISYEEFEGICELQDRHILIMILSCYDTLRNYRHIKTMIARCKYSLLKKLLH